jgi:hypothetical protein
MVDFWADDVPPAAGQAIRVVVINDLEREWNGAVTLRLVARRNAETPLLERKQDCRVASLGREMLTFDLVVPADSGGYRLVAELRGADGLPVRSLRDFDVLTPEDRAKRDGLAVGKPVTASSSTTQAGETYPAAFAVDGDAGTRWSSDFSDPQWLAVDLGSATKVSRVELEWEAAYGKAYRIQVSTDGRVWTDVHETDAGKGGLEVIRFAPVEARWVRMSGTQRATLYGYSLWEFRVFP